MMRVGSLFSGIGGLELGIERATGASVAWQVEQDPWCRGVLARHWPDAARFDDVCTVGARELSPVEVICGGFPCQDISVAGKQAGITGARSGLWKQYARIVREIRPRVVVVENVAALLAAGLDVVLGDLASLGYDAIWDCVPASAVGAPHRRDRLFVVAWRAVGDASIVSEREPADHRNAVAACGDARALAGGSGERFAAVADADHQGESQPGRTLSEERRRAVDGGAGLADASRGARLGDAPRQAGHAAQRREDVADAGGSRRREVTGGASGDEGPDAGRSATHDHVVDGSCEGNGPGYVADADSQRFEERHGVTVAARAEQRRAAGHGGGNGRVSTQPRLGRATHGFSAGLDRVRSEGHRWPARPGEAQAEWEAPRTARGVADRARRLKALGNAVVPQVAEAIGHVVADILRAPAPPAVPHRLDASNVCVTCKRPLAVLRTVVKDPRRIEAA